jgi:hypothetical protein
MTTHHELIDKVPENIYLQKIFAALSDICLQMCANMADPTQIVGRVVVVMWKIECSVFIF